MEKALGINGLDKPRDIDICFTGEDEDVDLSRSIAEKYCPDDLAHGYGIEKLEDNYFESRDFTLNEVLIKDNDIIMTKQCLLDTLRGVIRFSDYEKQDFYNNYSEDGVWCVNDKLASKALRLISERKNHRESDFVGSEYFDHRYINEFHISLHLDRALEVGYDVAIEFIKELKKYKQIPENIFSPKECMSYLENYTDFIFKHDYVAENYSDDYVGESNFEKEYKMLFEDDWRIEEKYSREIEKYSK